MHRAFRIFTAACMVLAAASGLAENWPGWRGPRMNGVSSESGIAVQWDLAKNLKWKVEVPGVGHSSPIVWGSRVFVTTAVSSDVSQESFKKGLYFGGERKTPDEAEYTWEVLAYDRDAGKLLWRQTASRGKPATTRHMKNSYASQTPVTDGRHVYAFFGDFGVHCFDFAGRKVWSRDLGSFKTRYGWGTASSPLLAGDRLILQCDQEGPGSFLVALDARTGKDVWKVERDEVSSWSTPYLTSRGEVVVNATKAIRAYDPATGKLLWEARGRSSSIAIPTPIEADGLLYVSSGYVMDKVRPLTAFRLGASGDLSLKEGAADSPFVAWSQGQAGPYNPTPVVAGGYVHVLYDGGFIACYDARTGAEVYPKRRIEAGALFTASPVVVEGKLYCASEDGDVYVIRAGPQYELLAKNPLGEVCMASPAVSGGKMLIRTFKHLLAIQ